MKIFSLVLLVLIVSCGESENKVIVTDKDTVAQSADTLPPKQEDKPVEKIYDTSIYHDYMGPELEKWIASEMPGLSLPSPTRWENYWFNQYKKNNGLVNFISGDLNCDDKKDYAVIVEDKNGNVSTWALIATKNGYNKHRLEDHGKISRQIDFGLELLPPGEINHIGESDEIPPPVKIKCPAIQLIWFETAARTYYLNNGKWKTLQTGD